MLTNIGGQGFIWPGGVIDAMRPDIHGGQFLLDAPGEKCAVIFEVAKSGTIDRVGFMTRAVTTSAAVRASLETVDMVTGLPTGTAYGSSVAGVQATVAADTQYEVSLATAATAVAGDIVALVFQFDSAAGNLTIGYIDGVSGSGVQGLPYHCQFLTAWAKVTYGIPCVSVRYSDGIYEPIGTMPMSPRLDNFIYTTSTPDELGNYFTVPATWRAKGFYLTDSIPAVCDLVLYEGSTALKTISIDPDVLGTTSTSTHIRHFLTPEILRPGVGYRAVIKPTSASGVWAREFVALNSAMLNMLPGGSAIHKTSRTDAGAWTEDTARRIWGLSLIVDQVHNQYQRRIRRVA